MLTPNHKPSRAKHIEERVCRALLSHREDLDRNRWLRFIKVTVRLNPKTGDIDGISVTKDEEAPS